MISRGRRRRRKGWAAAAAAAAAAGKSPFKTYKRKPAKYISVGAQNLAKPKENRRPTFATRSPTNQRTEVAGADHFVIVFNYDGVKVVVGVMVVMAVFFRFGRTPFSRRDLEV